MIYDQIIIPGQVISKKNSPRVTNFGGHSSIRASKRYEKYDKASKIYLAGRKSFLKEFPVFMHFKFIMESDRVFDFNNLSQGPQDILVQMGILPDDNYRYCIPVFFGKYAGAFKVKEDPKVIITFTDLDEMKKPEFLEGHEIILSHYKTLAEKARSKRK